MLGLSAIGELAIGEGSALQQGSTTVAAESATAQAVTTTRPVSLSLAALADLDASVTASMGVSAGLGASAALTQAVAETMATSTQLAALADLSPKVITQVIVEASLGALADTAQSVALLQVVSVDLDASGGFTVVAIDNTQRFSVTGQIMLTSGTLRIQLTSATKQTILQ